MNLIQAIKNVVKAEMDIRNRIERVQNPVHVQPTLELADGSHMIITKY